MDHSALDLATKTLAQAIDALMTMRSPFIPIVLVQRGAERELQRIVTERVEEAAAMAKQIAASQGDADASAFAVDAQIPYNGTRYDAIVVESWNFRTSKGARIGLRYELKGRMRKKPSLIGSPLHLDRKGWYDPEDGEPVEVPTFPEIVKGDPVFTPVVTPPPPSSAVDVPALPRSFTEQVVTAAVPAPVVDSAPPTAAHPVEMSSVPPEPAPSYRSVPIQRSETPLGNRAMFAGVMELATKGRSFPAFAIVQKDGVWEQVTMTDANLADTPASVRAYARSRTDAEFIAFAIDTFVAVDGVEVTAVLIEVWEYSTRVSFSVAQRYVPTGDPPSPRLSGRPLMRTQVGWVDVPSAMMLGGQVQFAYSEPGAM